MVIYALHVYYCMTTVMKPDILKLMGGGHDRMAVGFTSFDMENIKLTTLIHHQSCEFDVLHVNAY